MHLLRTLFACMQRCVTWDARLGSRSVTVSSYNTLPEQLVMHTIRRVLSTAEFRWLWMRNVVGTGQCSAPLMSYSILC
jgi:hypothetical protein